MNESKTNKLKSCHIWKNNLVISSDVSMDWSVGWTPKDIVMWAEMSLYPFFLLSVSHSEFIQCYNCGPLVC